MCQWKKSNRALFSRHGSSWSCVDINNYLIDSFDGKRALTLEQKTCSIDDPLFVSTFRSGENPLFAFYVTPFDNSLVLRRFISISKRVSACCVLLPRSHILVEPSRKTAGNRFMVPMNVISSFWLFVMSQMRIMWLIFFCWLSEPLLAKVLRYDSALGYQCTRHSHCSGLVANSMCVGYRCACRVGYTPDGIFRCVKNPRQRRQINFGKRTLIELNVWIISLQENAGIQMLGEDCESNDQCRRTPVDGSKACFLNLCQCSSGYVPIDAFRCIPDFGQWWEGSVSEPQPHLVSALEQISNNNQVVRSVEVDPPGYGSICTRSDDCRHPIVRLDCVRGSCACLEGYVPLGKYLCYSIDGHGSGKRRSLLMDFIRTFFFRRSTDGDFNVDRIDNSGSPGQSSGEGFRSTG